MHIEEISFLKRGDIQPFNKLIVELFQDIGFGLEGSRVIIEMLKRALLIGAIKAGNELVRSNIIVLVNCSLDLGFDVLCHVISDLWNQERKVPGDT